MDLRDRVRVFRDRDHAGAVLAEMLQPRFAALPGAVVLAIPAGGVPVAVPVARALSLPLDLAVVSKVTPSWNSEIGFGAIAFDGSIRLNDRLVAQLGLSTNEIEEAIARTREKVRRRNSELRQGRDYAFLAQAVALLVDDGLASGFTMSAAVTAVRAAGARSIVIGVPTAHETSVRELVSSVERVYCANVRSGPRFAVADAYEVWSDVDESMVRRLLTRLEPEARGWSEG